MSVTTRDVTRVCVQGAGGAGLQRAGQDEDRPGSVPSEEPSAGQRGGRTPQQPGDPQPEPDQVGLVQTSLLVYVLVLDWPVRRRC